MTSTTPEKIKHVAKNKKFIDSITTSGTHTTRHLEKSDAEILERTLSKKTSQGIFYKKDQLKPLITRTIANNGEDIAEWLNNSEELLLAVNYRSQTMIGWGAKQEKKDSKRRIRAMETPVMTAVFMRNKNTPEGFSLVTAYPNIEDAAATYSEDLQKRLAAALPDTETYKTASPAKKAALEYKLNPEANEFTLYDERNDAVQMYVYTKTHMHRMDITDQSIAYQNRKNAPGTVYAPSNAFMEKWLHDNREHSVTAAGKLQLAIRTHSGYQPKRRLPENVLQNTFKTELEFAT